MPPLSLEGSLPLHDQHPSVVKPRHHWPNAPSQGKFDGQHHATIRTAVKHYHRQRAKPQAGDIWSSDILASCNDIRPSSSSAPASLSNLDSVSGNL